MEPSARKWIFVASLLGAVGVALGAFGAHGLPDLLAEMGHDAEDISRRLEIFETAARYQMFHTLAIGLVATLLDRRERKAWKMAAWAFLIGVLVFSGLLYALTFVGDDYRWLGAIVPLGGLSLIAGWLLIAVGAMGTPLPKDS